MAKRVSEDLIHIMTDKVKELDAIDKNIAYQEKQGEWQIARDLAARRFHVENSIVKYTRRWINGESLGDYLKAIEAPLISVSKATQTEVSGEEKARITSRFETLYDAICRERDMWQGRCSDLLDLCLCDDCKVQKEEVYYTGSREEIICWKPCNCSGDCKRVRYRFQDF